jgi:ABC-type transport system involved in multi-copper enzyme maturation permease subunit
MTAATVTPETLPVSRPGLTSQMRAEWTKLRSTRAFYIQMGLALLLAVGMSALIALAIGSSWDQTSEAQRDDFDAVFVSLFGLAFSGIVLTVTGTTLMSSEYTSGMIRLTMTVMPRRLVVLFAKGAVVALVMWAIGFFVVLGSFVAGQAVLGTFEGVPTASFSDGASQRAIVAAWLTGPLFPLIGMTLGAILRSTASAITAVMALIFAPGIFGGILPAWWQENVIAYLPGNASDSLMRESSDSITYIEPALTVAALMAWIVAFFAVTAFLMSRRDV